MTEPDRLSHGALGELFDIAGQLCRVRLVLVPHACRRGNAAPLEEAEDARSRFLPRFGDGNRGKGDDHKKLFAHNSVSGHKGADELAILHDLLLE